MRIADEAKAWGIELLRIARARPVTAFAVAIGLIVFGRVMVNQLAVLGFGIYQGEGHHWRQAFTYGVAWNYAHTTLDFFHPRMFYEIAKSNIVAMEAPIYPYVCGFLLRLTRDSVWPMRFVSWLSLVTVVGVLWRWVAQDRKDERDVWGDRAGLLFAFGVSPSIGVEFRSVQPDPMCAALAMLAAYFAARYAKSERRRDLGIAAALAATSILTKPVALAIIPALVVLATYGGGRFVRRGLLASGAFAAALVPHFLWDKWAQHLLKTEMDGLIVISIQHDTKEMLANLKNVAYVREALLHFLPNYSASWWLVPAVAAGLYRGLADPRLRRFAVAMVVWLAVYMVELIAFGDRLHSNAYYFVLAPGAILLFAAYGIGALVRFFDSPRAPRITTRAALLTMFLPLGTYMSEKIDWATPNHPALALERNKNVWMNDLGLGLLCVLAIGAFACAEWVRPRRMPLFVGVPLIAFVLGSSYWASQDANQYFRYYNASETRKGWGATVATFRKAIDHYSKPSDRILIDPAELVFFHQARRNGFGGGELANAGGLEKVKARGARLYLQLTPGGNPPKNGGKLLASGDHWSLFCIADDGCP
jgi:hypothetical protein